MSLDLLFSSSFIRASTSSIVMATTNILSSLEINFVEGIYRSNPFKGCGNVEQAVVLVNPEYEINLGMVARAMKNFGQSELRIVGPYCGKGRDAVKYSKHAREILEGAKVYGSLREAVEDCDAAVGFTGVLNRHRGSIRAAVPLKRFLEKADGYGRLALVFGREGIGLNEKEIGECDYLVHVETSKEYPVLNLSHAVAVVLYALGARKERKTREMRLPGKEKEVLIDMFKSLVGRYKFRNPKRCEVAFRRVIGRANPTEKEGRSIMNVLRVAIEELEGRENEKDGAP
ncbi:TrmJ/YjtD family RNA methyltransferase [Candidatus Micrarchaeota archaeon]|nr:TrmJ/YjtD family RNA methyltransferase [Candidatus Micrarchaeota archaeon]MBD3417762.1 TrmJ/YjtD family RNA methyltransferase [Candidatus Micrarchaeota archaeon]